MSVSEKTTEISRDKKIIRTSIIGILANVLLATFKAVMGILSNSIAITLDAVNNISDVASSVITIIGTKLAGKSPDKKHPFGYGRIEYLSAMIIAVIVLYAGVTSFTESLKKIFVPETPEYSTVILIIVAVGVVVKIILGRYVKAVGVKLNSDSLINSGEDATLDSVISASTFVTAVIYMVWGVSLEAYLGVIISGIIIKSGIEMLRSAISQILGESADVELARAIKETVCSFEEVQGAYDLVLNNYGPDKFNGSIHIEIPNTCTLNRLDELTREITAKVYQQHDVILTAISIYYIDVENEEMISLRKTIEDIISNYPEILEIHGLFVQKTEKIIRFDLVVSLGTQNRENIFHQAIDRIKKQYPDYTVVAIMDTDFAES